MAAWEAWTLVLLAGLQLYVAYRWWTGSALPGTRGWIAALFLLNGAATVLQLVPRLDGPAFGGFLASVASRWTNIALLGFGLAALDIDDEWTRPRRLLAAPLALVAVGGIYASWLGHVGTAPDWKKLVGGQVLLLAIVVGAAALVRRARRWGQDPNPVWGLALGAVGLRYAELAAWLSSPPKVPDPALGAIAFSNDVLKLLALVAMAAAGLVLLAWYLRDPPTYRRGTYELMLAFLGAGFLYGAARAIGDPSWFAVVLTFTLVRPLAFLEAQARLDDARLWTHPSGRAVRLGACSLAAVLLGVGIAAATGFTTDGRLLVGGALLPFGAWLGHAVDAELYRSSSPLGPSPSDGSVDDPHWPVDADRLPLPEDWEDRLAEGYRAYRALPDEVRQAVDDLAYWERLLLALEGAPEGDKKPPYERTTPGLHLQTHCTYASIGPEIQRANERADVIAAAHDVDTPGPGGAKMGLVEDSYGRAQGVDSPRAKFYRLTPLGERVAAAVRERVGLGDEDPADVARLVATGFREASR